MEKQTLPQRMYETRMASLQRCVAFMVLFHEMGRRVQRFWPAVSFGRLRYDMDRTQSIMRIATTASPVSGMDVHAKMLQMAVDKQKANLLSVRTAVLYKPDHRGSVFEKVNKLTMSSFDISVEILAHVAYGDQGSHMNLKDAKTDMSLLC